MENYEENIVRRFRPERPIYLNEEVLGVHTKRDVMVVINTLRSQGWLVTYGAVQNVPELTSKSTQEQIDYVKSVNEHNADVLEPMHKKFDNTIELAQFQGLLEPFIVKAVPVSKGKKDTDEFADLAALTIEKPSKK